MSKKDIILYKKRPCNVNPSKLHPEAYSKDDLVKLAVKLLNYTESQAKRKTKDELCNELKKSTKDPSKKTLKKPSEKSVSKTSKKTLKKPTLSKKTTSKKTLEKPKTDKPPPKKKAVSKKTSSEKPPPKKKAVSKKTTTKKDVSKKVVTESFKKRAKKSLRLHQHQVKIEDYLMKKRGVVAAFSTGSGKTLTAINAAFKLLNTPASGIKKVLIVTNKSLISRFEEDILKYGEDPSDSRIVIITKDSLAKTLSTKKVIPSKKLFLIIDEVHNFKSMSLKTQRANAAKDCASKAGKVLLMTATPVYNDIFDAINLAAMVKGEEPISKKQLASMSDIERAKYFRCIFSFYDNTKGDPNYPTVKEHPIELMMTPEYQKKYQAVERQIINLEGAAFSYNVDSNPFLFYSGIRQATNCLSPCIKCIWIADKIKKDVNKKSVIYSFFNKKGTNIVKKTLDDNDIKYCEVTGSIDSKTRTGNLEKFNDPSSGINVLIISGAGGEGLDLKGVRNIIIVESGFNRSTEEQIIGRGARYQSHNHLPLKDRHVDVYHLILKKISPDPETGFPPNHLSADEKLKQLIDDKFKRTNALKNILIQQSIDKQDCLGKK